MLREGKTRVVTQERSRIAQVAQVRGRGSPVVGIPRSPEAGKQIVGGSRLPYLPGLDGLRALAVIAVLL